MKKIFVKTQNVKNFIGLVENLINKPKNIPKIKKSFSGFSMIEDTRHLSLSIYKVLHKNKWNEV